jgi:hypothetical protein
MIPKIGLAASEPGRFRALSFDSVFFLATERK